MSMPAQTTSSMTSDFPIPIPDRLPLKIDPCPIVEAILEIRFVTSESWADIAGAVVCENPRPLSRTEGSSTCADFQRKSVVVNPRSRINP